ncbi:NAD(P)-dependent alcohol dehydrogenase [Sinomonas terrae]|uniref:alcohol dehydrogenase (NADP(+)) n=1 Tax=Sinomonas terrae TaxID=2908838 RepID=A0ABS9U0Y4_9MICC|nr:NAD(P)-dependent alcohol dehydrogenase [Sinomonas terrae]MCH6470162.1 NAD(P)-dependent alcohol dehydrogenase [Sinomonas terrae]
MPTAHAYALPSADGELVPTTIERREPGPNEVFIAIRFAGICHSDIHIARGEWGSSPAYPIVVGHEIAGVVEAVGTEVTKHAVGDRVGVGCFVDSCRECPACLDGGEQFCKGNIPTYNSIGRDGLPTAGGYSTHITVDENYVVRIPDSLGLDVAAPLLCAGITLYSPLTMWGAGPGKQVAIIGMGGLGHMGVKIAHALGAEVSVVSQSLKKQDDAFRLGADHYYASSDTSAFEDLKGRFDLIVNTVSADLDLDAYLGLLALDGTLVLAGLPEKPMTFHPLSLHRVRRRIAGTKNGGIRQTQEMLDFCAKHGFGAEVEVIPAEKVNEAWGRVIASDVRYRFVIDTSTL